ncbi:efflux RND transporter periplasmic adaptor subunit [Edaphobacter modestus]|uniref:Multidrug efflux system membrane fusion protein n=1 Tax=Edaphobacter modestus TaxID=388466 RepID=A0A4Q7YUI9_9BACT|nr:biotin/lipoyl-binding protein [Edaphobacter modestus]RZU41280.1 multidrug efflux system membrane fusion protein [Edaphobacter modestus]
MTSRGPISYRQLGYVIVALAILVLTASALLVDRQPRTDDATVRANTIAFAPEVEGRLEHLYVQDNQPIHKGDLLFQIDPRPYEYALQQARAERATLEGQIEDERRRIAAERSAVGAATAGVSGSQSNISASEGAHLAAQAAVERARAAQISAEAQLRFAQNDYNRIEPLLKKHFVTVQQVDQTATSLHVAEEAAHAATSQLLQSQAQERMAFAAQQAANANLLASQSKLNEAEHTVDTLETLMAQRPSKDAKVLQAKLNLAWTSVRAPFNGFVTDMNISQGAYAHVGTPMFTLIDTSRWWVLASYRESKLKHIRPGSHVDVYLMDNPHRRFDGVVDSVGRGVFPEDGAVAAGLPQVDRTLNWVHLSARFPVRIRITNPDAEAFRIGATAITVVR